MRPQAAPCPSFSESLSSLTHTWSSEKSSLLSPAFISACKRTCAAVPTATEAWEAGGSGE